MGSRGGAGMENVSLEKKSEPEGCGLISVVLGCMHRRSSISNTPPNPSQASKDSLLEAPNGKNQADRITVSRTPRVHRVRSRQGNDFHFQARKAVQAAPGISGELETMIQDQQKSTGLTSGSLIRACSASSSNVMVYGNLGNLKQPGSSNNAVKEFPSHGHGKYSTSVMGNVVKKSNEPVRFCRALSTRMDPEQLKILGNEDYGNGRFAEAMALYDAAIAIDPNKASYRSNKSAALVALGRVLEAAFECQEAIRIDPFYQRAHNRLATIYVRLGELEKALHHFKQAGSEADLDAMNRVKQIQLHLRKCNEAKRYRDWNSLVKETSLSIAAGADSAPLIFGLQAEALLKTNKHDDAIETMKNCPNFGIDECTRIFGPRGSASILVHRSQVDLVAGRFDDSITAAQGAARLDPSNNEATNVLRRARTAAKARLNGNELFKASRYMEACIAYSEGLNHDPCNAILLCNRAACKSKLSHYEKAMEDCNAALGVRPSYTKARLRRAHCHAKMGKWEACMQDCLVLIKQDPDDKEVWRMLQEVKEQLEKQAGGGGMVVVPNAERFRN